MNLKDIKYRLLEFWNDFKREKSGLIGLGILVLCILVVVFEPVLLPYKATNDSWSKMDYWKDNSPGAAPVWTNFFAKKKSATTKRLENPEISDIENYVAPSDFYTDDYDYSGWDDWDTYSTDDSTWDDWDTEADVLDDADDEWANWGAWDDDDDWDDEDDEWANWGAWDDWDDWDDDEDWDDGWGSAAAEIDDSLTVYVDDWDDDDDDWEYVPMGMDVRMYEFTYNYKYDLPPLDLILHLNTTSNFQGTLLIERPDEKTMSINIRPVIQGRDLRFSLEADGKSDAFEFAKRYASRESSSHADPSHIRTTSMIFAQANEDQFENFESLKGEYKFKVIVPSAIFSNLDEDIDGVRFILPGRVSGLLGTDPNKRDIFSGVIAGLKWALFIGLVTSVVSVLIGVMYGIISAYLGGMPDNIMSVIFEFFISIPLLPVLIVLNAVVSKPSIWIIIGSLVVFSWTGSVKVVRSMGLQIKEETYIEAAKALGAGNGRIIFKHMAPILLPYSFANMALAVPGAIVTEASLSLLGLGDPSIVTWGQILHQAQASGATLNGMWWWIIPPGLFIALMGMTFAFVGFAMDKILHPKLRTR